MKSQTILLVEDDDNDVVLYRRAMQKAGIENVVRVVIDGQEAMHYLSGSGRYGGRAEFPLPQFIITDLKLPLKTGLDLVTWLRHQPTLRRIPAVVLSSTANPGEINQVYEAGANAFLVKPSGMDQLVELFGAIKRFWLIHNQPPTLKG